MLNVRKHRILPDVTPSAQRAIRIELHSLGGRQIFAVSPARAEAIRNDLAAALDRLRRATKEQGG